MLRRIYARCVGQSRRYKKNHAEFSDRYFCCGAAAVLTCFRDPAAKALANELIDDAFLGPPTSDQSAAAQAKRAQRSEAHAKFAAFMQKLSAELDAMIAGLTTESALVEEKEQEP